MDSLDLTSIERESYSVFPAGLLGTSAGTLVNVEFGLRGKASDSQVFIVGLDAQE